MHHVLTLGIKNDSCAVRKGPLMHGRIHTCACQHILDGERELVLGREDGPETLPKIKQKHCV